MKHFITIIASFICFCINAQQVTVSILPMYKGEPLVMNKAYTTAEGNLQITTLQFYLTNFQLSNKKNQPFQEPNSHHLIDLNEPASLTINLDPTTKTKFTTLQFDLGIDSLTNVSGAYGGDLDPTKGMYWTWQSGYINFKLEGTASNCPARKNEFNFHIGGYMPQEYALQTINVKTGKQKKITLELPIDQFFEQLNLEETYTIMSPGENAVELAQVVSKLFIVRK